MGLGVSDTLPGRFLKLTIRASSERKDQGGFTSLEYLGTSLNDGTPTADSACIKGFDNAG